MHNAALRGEGGRKMHESEKKSHIFETLPDSEKCTSFRRPTALKGWSILIQRGREARGSKNVEDLIEGVDKVEEGALRIDF